MTSTMPKFFGSRELKQCPICSRRFTTDRIKVHEVICQKSASTPRKLFDVSRQRIKGTEFEKITDKVTSSKFNKRESKGPTPLSTNWRWKHEDLIKALKSIKVYEAEKDVCKQASDLPLSPPVDCEDNIQCPHCLRLFNPSAVERHIVVCEKITQSETKSKTSMISEKSKILEEKISQNY